jgi:hypothetical protein
MPDVTSLKIAIQQALTADLSTIVGNGNIDILTGLPQINIGEAAPTAPGIIPFIGYDVLDTVPLAPDDPTLRNYISIVLIKVAGRSSVEATYLADKVSNLFTHKPCDNRCWYYDISNNCCFNTFTKFVSRLRFGRQGQNTYDHETNTWDEAVEVKFWWADLGCDGCTTLPPPITHPLENGDPTCDC